MFRNIRFVAPLALGLTFGTAAFAQEDLAIDVQIFDDVDSCDNDGVLDVGEVGRVVVVVRNLTDRAFADAAVAVKYPEGMQMAWDQVHLEKVYPFGVAVAEFEVELVKVVGQQVELHAVVFVPERDGVEPAKVERSFVVNVDEAVGVSNVDDVEYENSAWRPRFDDRFGAGSGWSRGVDEEGNHVWFVVGTAAGAHASLESPVLRPAHGEDFVLAFDHRYEFGAEGDEGAAGGVIEMSSDGGLSWQDVSQYAEVPYDGDMDEHASALEGRLGFVARNASLPGRDRVELNFGHEFQGEALQLRFRYAAAPGKRAAGWELDDFEVRGTYNAPFDAVVEHRGKCEPQVSFAGGKPQVRIYLPDDPQGDAQGFEFQVQPYVVDLNVPEAPAELASRPSAEDVAVRALVERSMPYQATARTSGFGRVAAGQVVAAGCTSYGAGASSAPLALLFVFLGFGYLTRRR